MGSAAHDIKIPDKGRVQDDVIEGAFRVLDDFKAVDASIDAMKSLDLRPEEEQAFATAAHTLRYGERTPDQPCAPITVNQLTQARRVEDTGASLWLSLNRALWVLAEAMRRLKA